MQKKFYILLIVMVTLAGILLFKQINRTRQITVKQNATTLIAPNPIPIPISDTELIFGNPGAPITIVEFADLGCKQCLSLHNAIQAIVAQHPQEMRLVWKDAPQPKIFSKDLTLAHQAGWCIGQQDQKKFWQFLSVASQNNVDLDESGLKSIAAGLTINTDSWWQCTTSDSTKQKIADSVNLASSLGIRSVPAIFINNKLINTKADINIQEMLANFIAK